MSHLPVAICIRYPPILATLLVNMLRIHLIFNKIKLHLNHYCTDLSLALYVFLILVPDILVNLIWSFVDHYQMHYNYEIKDGYIHLKKLCRSNKYVLLFGLLIVYLLVLILALAIMAILTRRVRRHHFKDTKKVNILLFIFCIIIVVASFLFLATPSDP